MPKAPPAPAVDATLLLVQALAWIGNDEARGARLLALTGIVPEELRARAMEDAVLSAVGDFLMAHEPDLVACAAALGVDPAVLAGAAS